MIAKVFSRYDNKILRDHQKFHKTLLNGDAANISCLMPSLVSAVSALAAYDMTATDGEAGTGAFWRLARVPSGGRLRPEPARDRRHLWGGLTTVSLATLVSP
jgi:hypothetical protein